MSKKEKKYTLEIHLSEKKMEVLEYYMKEKSVTVDEKFNEYVNTLYEKMVPQQVKNLLEGLEKLDAEGGQENGPGTGSNQDGT